MTKYCRGEIAHRAIESLRWPYDERPEGDKAAVLTMWYRIANIDLSKRPLDADESEFLVDVANRIVQAEKESAKTRPRAVVAACGLTGRAPSIVEGLVLDLLFNWHAFDDVLDHINLNPTPDEIFNRIKTVESLQGMSERNVRKGIVKALDMLRKR